MTAVSDDAVFFDDAENIHARANFFPALEISEDQVGPILGKYYLLSADRSAWLVCGLNGCNQVHRKGFLISNKSGQETICGSTCGEKKLGTVWNDVVAAFKLREDAAARKRVVDDLLSKRDTLLKRCAEVQPRAEKAAQLMGMFRRDFQRRDSVWRELVKCAKQGGVVRDSVQLQGKFHDRPRSETLVTIGVIGGSSAIQNDRAGLAALIKQEIEPWLRVNLLPDAMAVLDRKSLDAATRKASLYASQLVDAENYVGVVLQLISLDTLAVLQKMRDRGMFNPGYEWDTTVSEWEARIKAL